MNDLVKHSGALESMPKVRDIEKVELFKAVNAAIGKSFADAGQKMPEDNDRDYLVNQVVKDIQTYTPTLRLEEIGIAFQNGMRGKYGEYFGLNVVTFNKFLVAYLASGERDQRILAERKEVEEQRAPTHEELDRRWMGHLRRAFEVVKSGEFFEDHNNEIYKWLDGKGKIGFTPERKKSFMEQARQQLTEEKKAEKGSADYFKRQHLARIIETIQGEERAPIVTIRAMKIALNVWIRENLEMEVIPEMIFENE